MKSNNILVILALGLLLANVYCGAKYYREENHVDSEEFTLKHQLKDDDHLYIHIVPHTHDDVGWLKTADEYFSGFKYTTQKAGVELILNTVMDELILDPTRTFTYVEMYFFQLWWKEQTEDMKQKVRQIVNEGRLEFLNAGWSMHDEACPYFEDMINNMMHGHQFLLKEFGIRPKVGWHIDPFGHSNANPRLFAEMGLDAWFIVRMDFQDRERRLQTQEMEWVWRPMFNHFGKKQQIFTHCTFDGSGSPKGLDWDTSGSDDSLEDDASLTSYNADEKVQAMMDWIVKIAPHYRAKHLLVFFGDDFNYGQAKLNFQSIDKLIKLTNANYTNVTLMYSTPSKYLDALRSMQSEWPTKYDDMFPYADKNMSYWTGYFTSRPNAKGYIRKASSNLHASNKIFALQAIKQTVTSQRISDIMASKNKMMDALGINQHHDAVTGTSKARVVPNYNWRISKSMQFSNKLFSQVIGEKIQSILPSYTIDSTKFQWCFSDNSTYLDCPIVEHNFTSLNMIVAIFNPAPQPQNYLKIAVPNGNLSVQALNQSTNKFYTPSAVVLCSNDNFLNGITVNNCWLHVQMQVDAQQVGVLMVTYNPNGNITKEFTQVGTPVISSDYETLTLANNNTANGNAFTLEKKMYNQTFKFSVDLRYWPSYQEPDQMNSGAYMFRVKDGVSESLKYSELKSVEYIQTDVISQIRMKYQNELNESGTVIVSLYKKNNLIQWDLNLDGIPLNPQGQEVIIQFLSEDIDNNSTFYTDSNGLEMQTRILNYRPTWSFNNSVVNITQNYYPVNSGIAVKDIMNGNQMTVITTRTHGGSSLFKGQIELMHQRRTYYDDWKGLAEPLNDTDAYGNGESVYTTYYFQLFNSSQESSRQRQQQVLIDDQLQTFFTFDPKQTVSKDLDPIQNIYNDARLLNTQELTDIGITDTMKLQLFSNSQNSIIVRLANLADKFDLGDSPVTPFIKINELADQLYKLVNGPNTSPLQTVIQETSLTANQLYVQMEAGKSNWKGVDDDTIVEPTQPIDRSYYEIALEPQRIRTFIIQYVQPSLQTISQEFLN